MDRRLLKEYIRSVIVEGYPGRKLRIFDFDDTLVKTRSMIYVTDSSGQAFSLTPGEFAVYEEKPGDKFDFSDFSRLADPQEIKWTVKILKSIVAKGSEVVILTARAVEDPVHQFMDEIGLPRIEVIALADSNPQRKADYVALRAAAGDLSLIEFFDDSAKNVAAVAALQRIFPDVKIIARQVNHQSEDPV
ncbi:MAG: hypothetical protein EBR82_00365 [Caulobacteraceae bacterium]|nr:hypothetical protein [Caulobacteraceae bacterium]